MKAVADPPGAAERPLLTDLRLADTVGAANPVEPQVFEPAGRLVAGRYWLHSRLGSGGMGLVWAAVDELLHRPVALKQLVLTDQCGKTAAQRARVEADAAARVAHDGVVRIHGVVEDGPHAWIVMELLSGRTLAEALYLDGPLPVAQATHLGLSLLDGLRATHRAGVVHCDVKPSNVYLCDDGRIVLTDFGVAYTAGDDIPDVFAGSPAFASPERLRGDPPGPASDLYSLGATLFMAVEGTSPFDNGDDLVATLNAVTAEQPVLSLRAGALRPVIEGLLAKDPHQRLTADQADKALRTVRT